MSPAIPGPATPRTWAVVTYVDGVALIGDAAATTLNHMYAVETVVLPEPQMPRVAATARPGLIRALGIGSLVVVAMAWLLWPQAQPPPEPATRPLALPEPPPLPPPQPVFKDEAVPPAAQAPPTVVPAGETASPPPPEPETPGTAESPAPASAAASDDAQPGPPQPPATVPTEVQAAQTIASPTPQPKPEPAPAPAPAAAPQPKTASGQAHGSTWLLKQRKDHYVVQLMAARDLQVVTQFIGEHALGAKAAVFSTRREGLPWHVLLYGLYANADVARASIAELPSGLRRHSPWIRSVASVQQAIRDRTP